jgi:hypothetical protein
MVFCIMIVCVSRRWALCPCLRRRDEDGKSCKQDLAVLRDAFRFFLSTQVIAAGEQLSANSEQYRKSNVIVLSTSFPLRLQHPFTAVFYW